MNKQELKYILYAGGFAFLFFMFILPWAIKTFNGNDPIFQFIFFNIGIYAFLFIFLKSMVMNSSVSLKTSIGLLSLFISLDTLMPEYHVGLGGELIKGAALGVSTPDYVFGYIAQNLGLTGFPVYLMTYLVFPMLLLLVSAKTIKNFVGHV